MPILGRNPSTHHKQTALFDIRLQGVEHDVLVIKGAQHDASSVLLSGTIVLSVLEPMSIKKLSLRLYATLRLKWTNVYETQRGSTIKKPFRFEKQVFEHNWDNFEIQNYFSNLYDNYGSSKPLQNNSAGSSSTSLKSLGVGKKSKSSSNLVSFGSTASLSQSQNHILLQGNYEFPFSAILPGSTLESVEGLPGASLVYKLQATIERGRFSNDLVAKRHLRIVRTLTPDAVELSETMAVDNTWPKKVEYTISIPSRAVAIGSGTPIHMLFVPLAKGLKLGKVKITLVEYYSCCGSYGPNHSGERNITELEVPPQYIELTEDRWEINTILNIPPSLSKCTQDVDILTNIKVRHKLKFVVGLINPDGHVSELRASLPIVLFISPFVTVGVKNFDRKDSVADNSFAAFAEIPSDGEHEPELEDDDVIFAPDPEMTPAMVTRINSQPEIAAHLQDFDREAPPNYGNHIYDRLWSQIPIDDTPEGSRAQTPGTGTPIGSGNHADNSVDDSRSLGKLTENLRQLHLQRANEQNHPSLDSLAITPANNIRPSFTLGGEADDDEDDSHDIDHDYRSHPQVANARPVYVPTPTNQVGGSETDYFSISVNRGNAITSPGVTPGFNHLSRVNSREHIASPNLLPLKDWDPQSLSRVPSYQAAIRSPTFDEFSPAYAPSPSDDLTRPKSIHLKSSSLNNSRHESTAYLSNLRGGESLSLENPSHLRSKTSSTNTSPTISRNASSSLLSSAINTIGSSHSNSAHPYSKSPSKAKFLSNGSLSFGGMTPVRSELNLANHSSDSASSHPHSLSAHSRSSSFVNLMGSFVHKKDKKEMSTPFHEQITKSSRRLEKELCLQ